MRMIIGENARLANQSRRLARLVSEETNSLNTLRDQLRDRHIRAAARKLLLRELKGNSTSLFLNKQAATAGVIALCSSPDQSPLGPIYVTIDSRQVAAVIDWLTAYEPG
jgi:predicted RNA binding protein with dsRBD fold (UPF0201 family)